MKTEILPLLKSGMKELRILLICLIIIVTVIMSVSIFIFNNFSLGYEYMEMNNQLHCERVIGYSKEKISVIGFIEEYLGQLENNGYYVSSYDFKKVIHKTHGLIPKKKTNEELVKDFIIENLEVNVFCKKVTIGDDVFYFKNEVEKNEYIKLINGIDKVDCLQEDVVENMNKISSQEVLNNKINEIKDIKAKKDEEIRKLRMSSISSRGGGIYKNSTKAPMASYIYISSPYGMRHGRMHTGVDFAANAGTCVYAWKSGKVIQAGWNGSYGNFIAIQHNDGTVSRYAHLSGYACSFGQVVSEGQTIGYVGTTGNSTGNHLHFEIKINGKFVNPLYYL